MTTNPTSSTGSDELDYLVRSLDELDREFEAGDLDPDDYNTLRNDYTVRIADEMRRRKGTKGRTSTGLPSGSRLGRWLLIGAAIATFALGAGWLVARSAGERGVNDALTGNINETPRQQNARCQELAAGGSIIEALECFDEVLAADPDNVEALTYRGWYLVLASTSASTEAPADGGMSQQVELMASAMTYLDRAIEIDPSYPDALAFRSVAFDRLGLVDEACADVTALLALDPPEFFVNQTAALVQRNGCEA